MDALPADAPVPEPLAVLRARGDAAQIDRADLLPGLSAQADVTADGVETGLVPGAAQGAEVLARITGNLAMFTSRYKVGRRTLPELVAEHDRHARLARDQAALRDEIVQKRLSIARARGVLGDGAQM